MTIVYAPPVGSLTDLWVIVVLIIPGFLTFKIISWLAAYELKVDQFTTTIYSLICSMVLLIPISYIYHIQSLNGISVAIVDSRVMLSLLGFAILFGVIPGILLRKTLRKKFKFRSPWDGFADDLLGKAVIIYTSDNKEYIGWIKRISRGKDEKKEISLGNPKQVIRTEGKKQLVPLGDELLFTENTVKTILRRPP